MKYIKKFNKINESIDHLLPEDGGYRKLDHSQFEKFCTTYPCDYDYDRCSSLLMGSIDKMAALCGDPYYQSKTHLPRLVYMIGQSESYIDLKMHIDNWIVVNNQYMGDNHFFICDGEDGLNKFIKHWNYDIRKNKNNILIIESVDYLLPEDGGYKKINMTNFLLFNDMYPSEEVIDSENDFYINAHNIISDMCVGIIDIDKVWFQVNSCVDNWMVVQLKILDDIYCYVCDGETGVLNFCNNFNTTILSNYSTFESVDYLLPEDNSYTRVGDTRFAEFLKEYPYLDDDTLTPELTEVMRVIYEKCGDKTAYLSDRRALCSYETDTTRLGITATASIHPDNWYSIMFKLDSEYVTHATYYICDGNLGLEEFARNWTGIHLDIINENMSYLPEGSYSKLVETDILNFVNTYGKPRINLDLMGKFKSYLNTNDIKIIDQISSNEIIIVVHGVKIATRISEHDDMWISIVYGKDFYICDQESGMYELFDYLLNNSILENASYLPTGLYSEISADEWTDFLLTFGSGDVDNHMIDILLDYTKSTDIEVVNKSYNYAFMRPNGEEFYASVYKHDDHWISVLTSDRGLFLCDQEDGMIALFREILMPIKNNNDKMITESVEDNVEDGSYLEIDKDDVLVIWKTYGPSAFAISEIEQLTSILGDKYSINRFEKGNVITIYNTEYRELSKIFKFDDGWFICNNEPDANFLCDQIDGVIKFIHL